MEYLFKLLLFIETNYDTYSEQSKYKGLLFQIVKCCECLSTLDNNVMHKKNYDIIVGILTNINIEQSYTFDMERFKEQLNKER